MFRTLHIADTEYLWIFAFITFTFVLKSALLVLKCRSPSAIVYCVYAVPLTPAALWNGYLSRGKNQRQQTAHDSNSFSTFYFT